MSAKPPNSHSSNHSDSHSNISSINFYGPSFEIDDQFNIVKWSEETTQATGISADIALKKKCWEVIYPECESKPSVCEEYCLAKEKTNILDVAELKPSYSTVNRCASVQLPFPLKGSIIWIPNKESQSSISEPLAKPSASPMEEIIVRGCLSTKINNLQETLDFVRRYSAADDCELFLADPSQREVLFSGSEGPDSKVFSELTSIPFGAGYPGGVTERQTTMYTNDLANEKLFLREGVRKSGLRSFLGIPLSENGMPVGYLGLGWRMSSVSTKSLIQRLNNIKPLLHTSLQKEKARLLTPKTSLTLSIRCFGAFEISRFATALPTSAFSRRRALLLLKILLLQAPQPVHRDQLIDFLWPETNSAAGRNRLHGVIHALRATIDPSKDSSSFVKNDYDFYYFDNSLPQFVDLFYFKQALKIAKELKQQELSSTHSSIHSSAQLISSLESAVSLYRGDLFMDEPYFEWLEGPRSLFRQQYISAVRELVNQYTLINQFEKAIPLLQTAISLCPHYEDLHVQIVQIFLTLDRKSEAIEQLKLCLQQSKIDNNQDFLPETIRLAKTLGLKVSN